MSCNTSTKKEMVFQYFCILHKIQFWNILLRLLYSLSLFYIAFLCELQSLRSIHYNVKKQLSNYGLGIPSPRFSGSLLSQNYFIIILRYYIAFSSLIFYLFLLFLYPHEYRGVFQKLHDVWWHCCLTAYWECLCF